MTSGLDCAADIAGTSSHGSCDDRMAEHVFLGFPSHTVDMDGGLVRVVWLGCAAGGDTLYFY